MKILNNLKALFTQDLSAKDITLPVSKLAGLWDAGKDLLSGRAHRRRPSNPYSQVDTVWTCVNLIIDIGLSIQLMLSTADDEIIEDGPVYEFLFNNKSLPYKKLFTETVGFYLLFREVYWVTKKSDQIRPTDITVVSPRQMTPVVKDGVLLGYDFRSGNTKLELDIDDVFCIKNFNPADPYRGLGPLDAGTLSLSVAYQALQYNESSLANGARLSTILSVPAGASVTEPEIEKMRREFRAKQGGAENAADVFFASGGVTVDTVSQTMADLQMMELSQYTDQKICSLFGVPPECVGLVTEAQYAQGPATQRLILYGVAPILSALAEGIDDGILERYRFTEKRNKSVPYAQSKRCCGVKTPLRSKAAYRAYKLKALQGRKNVFCWFDVDSHPAIQEMLRSRTEKMLPFVKEGIPLAQIVDAGDLPFDTSDLPWASEWWVSAGLVPARWILDAGFESVTGPAAPEAADETTNEDDPEKSIVHRPSSIVNEKNAQQKLRIWRKWVTSWQQIEKEYTAAMRTLFLRQQRELLTKLEKAFKEQNNRQSSIVNQKSNEDLIARIVFDLTKENGKIKVINKIFFEKASALGAAQTISEVSGLEGDALKEAVKKIKLSPVMRQSLAVSSHKIQGVNSTTQNRVARQLAQGLEKGEGLNDLSKRIKKVLGDNRKRTLHIARTQTAGAVSTGRQAGMTAAGVELKSWLTSHDTVVRKAHKDAETTHKDGIAIDQAFWVGGEALMFPADPGGSPGNIINCRCLQIAKKFKGKTLDLDFYDRVKFLDAADIKTLLNEV